MILPRPGGSPTKKTSAGPGSPLNPRNHKRLRKIGKDPMLSADIGPAHTPHPPRRPHVPDADVPWDNPYALARYWVEAAGSRLPDDRDAASELHEIAIMSTLADWLRRWLPIYIHAALMHGASVPAVAAAAGIAPHQVPGLWEPWATRQLDLWHTSNPHRRIGLNPEHAARVRAVLDAYTQPGEDR